MAISVDGQSLVGRTALLRGPAHKIRVDPPLTFTGRALGLDPAFKPGGGDVPPSVAFRAHKNGVQQTGIPANIATKLSFGTEVYDVGGFYNPGTGRWTPPLGIVHIDGMVWFSAGVSGTAQIGVWKNGVILARAVNTSPSSSDGVLVSVDDVANGTDYYEIFALVSGANAVVNGTPELTFFSGHVPSGQQGVQGIQGPIGNTGPQGQQGIQGVKGDKGDLGNTGPQGIQGIQGPTGATGPQGPTGDQGNPGALWYQGVAAPTGATGSVGDFYLRISTGDVYNKTSTTTWALLGNITGPRGLQGIQGPTGADSTVPGPRGSVWYDGAGAPSAGLGVNDDFYLNHSNGDAYHKVAGAWSVVANITGPQGIQGIQGLKGDTGNVGPQGSVWYSGTSDPAVGLGVNGDYYFNNSTQVFWKKTSGTWAQIANLASGSQAIGFFAHKNGVSQTLGASGYTKLTCATEVYDRGGYYDPALSRWTPPAGLVHIDASIYATATANSTNFHVFLYKNGAAFRSEFMQPTISVGMIEISVDDVANGTDYYEFYVYATASTVVDGSTQYTFWNGHVVSPQGPRGDTGLQGVKGDTGAQGIQGPIGLTGADSSVPGPPATYPTGAHGFTAHKTADQPITSNTWTKVDFGVEIYDTGMQYDMGTSRYVPVAGDAFFVASVYCSGLVLGSNIYLAIYKNGALFRAATHNNTNGSAQIVCTDNANGTDYYEAWVYATATGANFTVPTGENNLTFFQGFQPVGPTGPQGPAGFGIVQIGTVPPASPSVGNFWYDTTTGILSVWIDDGSSSQWLQIAPTINLDTSNISPALQGTPTSTTPTAGDSSTRIATTAFVTSAIAALGNLLHRDTTDTISTGYTITPYNLGNITNFTLNPALGNYQYGTNNGAATWTAPTVDCAMDVLVTNSATAGTITFSGFTVGANTGDTLTVTNGNRFIISIRRINAIATYVIKALQ
jgi:Collagen triple helix repeat (20 copies)